MSRSLWALVLGVALACSATPATPSGERVVEWDLQKAGPSPPAVVGAKTSHEKTFQTAGAELRVNFDTAEIRLSNGLVRRSPIHVVVTVVQSGGYAVSGGLTQFPMHYAGTPPEERSIDFRGTLSKGRTSCMGTRYQRQAMNVRIHGSGSAELRPEADPAASGP